MRTPLGFLIVTLLFLSGFSIPLVPIDKGLSDGSDSRSSSSGSAGLEIKISPESSSSLKRPRLAPTPDYYYDDDFYADFESSDEVVEYDEGEIMKIKCRLPVDEEDSSTGLDVDWYYNGSLVDVVADPRMKELVRRKPYALRVRNLRMEDAGEYRCYWTADNGASGWYNYTIYVSERVPYPVPQALRANYDVVKESEVNLTNRPPLFTKDNRKDFIVKPAGNVVDLKCNAVGGNISFVWFKNGKTPERKLGAVKLKGPLLRMRNLIPSDSGNYTCIVSNKFGSVNRTYTLQVVERLPIPPLISPLLSNQTGLLDQPVRMECIVISDQVPYISWIKHNTTIKVYLEGQVLGNYTLIKDGKNVTTEDPQVLFLDKVQKEDEGWYTCIAANSLGNSYSTAYLTVEEPVASRPIFAQELRNLTAWIGSNALMEVNVYQFNKPNLNIFWCKGLMHNFTEDNSVVIDRAYLEAQSCQDVKNGTTGDPQVLFLEKVKKEHEGWYTCIATNNFGNSYSTAYLSVDEAAPISLGGSDMNGVVLTIAIVGAMFFFLIAICVYFKLRQKKFIEKDSPHLPKKKVNITRGSSDVTEEPLLESIFKVEISESHNNLGSAYSNSKSEYELPLDSYWEVTRSKLSLGEFLGEGAFGKVLKANTLKSDLPSTVAVKMLKGGYTDSEMIDLVSEMEVMKLIGPHINILNLLGCCTQDGPLYVIVEYARYGNLRDYLRKMRHSTGYERAIGEVSDSLTQKDLVNFALQVSKGMEYLSSRKFIHRDLAARNVLVSEDLIMKIGDFGLTRNINCRDYYVKKGDGRLPVKWMAPEAIFQQKYTTQSDVWAFGVLLWEIMTLGENPWPSAHHFDMLRSQLQSASPRMEQPANCSKEIYTIMCKCWIKEPNKRPTFTDLKGELDRIYSSATEEYLDLSSPLRLDTPPAAVTRVTIATSSREGIARSG